MKILAIVESLTGNTMSFIEYAEEIYGDEVSIDIIDPFTVNNVEWDNYDKVMIGCYTWSEGKMPIEIKSFIIENREILLDKDVLLFGSGWSVYSTFCLAVDGMYIILDEKFPTIKFELRFDKDIEEEAVKTLHDFIKGEN